MYLFVGISIITFLLTFSQSIIKFFSLGSYFAKQHDDPRTLEEIELAKQELKEIDKSELGDYAKMVRRLRAENKIISLRKKLSGDKDMTRLKGASVDLICGYVVKAVLLLMLITISIKYRYTPVVVFDDRFNFAPFSGIVMFPTSVNNAISVPFCVLSCNLTFRWLGSVLKGK